MIYALIFAGGVGKRMLTNGLPKQFLEIHGKPILAYTIEHFQNHDAVDKIVLVSVASHITLAREIVEKYGFSKVIDIVPGGKTGQESIFHGLERIAMESSDEDIVLIHDGVRPLIDASLISDNIEGALQFGNAVSAIRAYETCCLAESNGCITEMLDRSKCVTVRAPQTFYVKDIWAAHCRAREEGYTEAVDSASLINRYGGALYCVDCSVMNIKITTPADFYIFKTIIDAQENKTIF